MRLSSGFRVLTLSDLATIWRDFVGASISPSEPLKEGGMAPESPDPPPTHPGASYATTEPIPQTPISQLGLGGRLTSILTKLGYITVESLPTDRQALIDLPGVGETFAGEITHALGRVGR